MIPAVPSSLSHPAVPPSAALKPLRPAASSEGGVLAARLLPPCASQPTPGGEPSPAGAGGFPGSEEVGKRFWAAVADTGQGATLNGAFRQAGPSGGQPSPVSPTGTPPALLHSLAGRKGTSPSPRGGLGCLSPFGGLAGGSPALQGHKVVAEAA